MADEKAPRDPLDHLSPTKFDTMGSNGGCDYKAFRRYVLGEKKPPGGALIYGSAMDETLNYAYGEKMKSGKDEPVDVFQDKFVHEFDTACKEETGYWDKAPADLRSIGITTAGIWRDQVSVRVEPKMIQREFLVPIRYKTVEGEDRSFNLWCFLDLVDGSSGRNILVDNKTAGRKWSKNQPLKETQPLAYSLAASLDPETKDIEPNVFEYHIGVKKKVPEMQHPGNDTAMRLSLNTDDRIGFHKRLVTAHAKFADMIKSETFLPNRRSNLCSKRWCAWHEECVAEWGGEVPE